MAELFSDFNMDDSEVYTPVFNAPTQQYVMRYNGIMQPLPAIVLKQESLGTQNKDAIVAERILRMGSTNNFGLGIHNCVNVEPNHTLSDLQFLNEEILQDNNGIQVSCEPSEEDTYQNENCGTRDFEELIVNASDVVDQGNADSLMLDDPDMAAALEMINSEGISKPVEFKSLPSDKKRNPPYLIREDSSKIATRNEEPVKFSLSGAKVCQLVKISMRFSEEKFKNTPVYACPLHQSEGENGKVNFKVSTDVPDQCRYDDILGHYTASLSLCPKNFDDSEDFSFHVTFRCLNSCHKENGKKMELILTLMDMDGKALKESRFEIRACKNVKRDYKEAFQDDDQVSVKQMRPDSFISAEYPQPSSSVREEVNPGKKKEKTVKVQMIHPVGDAKSIKKEHHQGKAVKCVPAPETESGQRKFYLIQLPDANKERLTLGMIRELGGQILNLDSVVPADINEEDYDDILDNP